MQVCGRCGCRKNQDWYSYCKHCHDKLPYRMFAIADSNFPGPRDAWAHDVGGITSNDGDRNRWRKAGKQRGPP
eukprot:8283709-Pyramimonas_sp.AAC.1